MTLIIDGHNLIPKIPGLSLADEHDEQQLLEIVREYCRLTRNHAEVFFDGAPPPQRGPAGGGLVHAHYVRKGTAADDAIIAFVQKSGRNARNLTVVTSDRRVQAESRALGSAILGSEELTAMILRKLREKNGSEPEADANLSPDEIDNWMKIFSSKQDRNS